MLLFFFHHAHQWMAVQVNDEHYLRRALGNVIGTAKADALRLTSSRSYPNLAATLSDTHALEIDWRILLVKLHYFSTIDYD